MPTLHWLSRDADIHAAARDDLSLANKKVADKASGNDQGMEKPNDNGTNPIGSRNRDGTGTKCSPTCTARSIFPAESWIIRTQSEFARFVTALRMSRKKFVKRCRSSHRRKPKILDFALSPNLRGR